MTRDELISALEKAPGHSASLDLAIHDLIESRGMYHMTHTEGVGLHRPHYTASRDAMLPGAEALLWSIHNNSPNEWHAATDGKAPVHKGIAATEPLARRIAEIKALVP